MENKKIRVNYSISKSLVDKFTKTVKENAINRSALIEILIAKWLEQFNKN